MNSLYHLAEPNSTYRVTSAARWVTQHNTIYPGDQKYPTQKTWLVFPISLRKLHSQTLIALNNCKWSLSASYQKINCLFKKGVAKPGKASKRAQIADCSFQGEILYIKYFNIVTVNTCAPVLGESPTSMEHLTYLKLQIDDATDPPPFARTQL